MTAFEKLVKSYYKANTLLRKMIEYNWNQKDNFKGIKITAMLNGNV